jgi:hypothetical protein
MLRPGVLDRGYSFGSSSNVYEETAFRLDDIEKLERGEAGYMIKDELYLPVHPTRDWVKCYVVADGEFGFRYVRC